MTLQPFFKQFNMEDFPHDQHESNHGSPCVRGVRALPHGRQPACLCRLWLDLGSRWQVGGCQSAAPHGRQRWPLGEGSRQLRHLPAREGSEGGEHLPGVGVGPCADVARQRRTTSGYPLVVSRCRWRTPARIAGFVPAAGVVDPH